MQVEITIYELLGLIKDNKAPKKIRCDGLDYEFSTNDEGIDYIGIDKETSGKYYLTSVIGNNYLSDIFSTTVEIVEEEKEIEELDLGEARPNGECIISINDKKIQDKINELVREVNKLKNDQRIFLYR